jgi:TonB family protein
MRKISLIILQVSVLVILHAHAAATNASIVKVFSAGDSICTSPDIQAYFPGGSTAWESYLIHNLIYPIEAQQKGVEGRVEVSFIVEKNGRLHHIHVLDGPALLQDEALRLIKDSRKWEPAIKNGQKVSSYKIQGFLFRIA